MSQLKGKSFAQKFWLSVSIVFLVLAIAAFLYWVLVPVKYSKLVKYEGVVTHISCPRKPSDTTQTIWFETEKGVEKTALFSTRKLGSCRKIKNKFMNKSIAVEYFGNSSISVKVDDQVVSSRESGKNDTELTHLFIATVLMFGWLETFMRYRRVCKCENQRK